MGDNNVGSALLDPNMWSIETLFGSRYSVPVYQRPYAWDLENVRDLLEDIYNDFKTDKNREGYYTGNIILRPTERINGNNVKFDVIDGQQRITTFVLLLLAIYCIAIESGIDKKDEDIKSIKNALWFRVERISRKDIRAIELGNLEKEILDGLFDYAFDFPEKTIEHYRKKEISNAFEKRIIDNFLFICSFIKNTVMAEKEDVDEENDKETEKDPNEKLLDFSEYFLTSTRVISIIENCALNKVFSMFESINGKGKKLEEIDLIKSYIFSKLDESEYDHYLNVWGELIVNTSDHLYDYLYNYIKAFLTFYRKSITVKYFKNVCKNSLSERYKSKLSQDELESMSEDEIEKNAIKMLLDDLRDKLKYYNMLYSIEKMEELIVNHKLRFYYKLFIMKEYNHPKPVILRGLFEYEQGKISKDDFVSIVVESIAFMMKVVTIGSRDSKDVITLFSGIMNNIYETDSMDAKGVINDLANAYRKQAITKDQLVASLTSADYYSNNKEICIALQALFEATDIEKKTVSYDKAYTLMNAYGETFTIDHILPQTPKEDDDNFKYYKDDSNNTLVLKNGHDFPSDLAVDGMNYADFISFILNRMGNLRLDYWDKNSSKGSDAIQLKEYKDFYDFKSMKSRGLLVANTLFDICIPQPIPSMEINTSESVEEKGMPKMDKLIECGYINPGDKMEIKGYGEESQATLIDYKTVEYKGDKISPSEWGRKVTGWPTINIYRYACIKGEDETLQEKRNRYIDTINE